MISDTTNLLDPCWRTAPRCRGNPTMSVEDREEPAKIITHNFGAAPSKPSMRPAILELIASIILVAFCLWVLWVAWSLPLWE